MMQREQGHDVHVAHEYVVDTLGAPFQVILVDSVCVHDAAHDVDIPDLPGLINAVVRSRVMHPRKLSGLDLKFIRKSICVRAKVLADFLEMTPEHLSRCESGERTLSSASEKQLRLASFFSTLFVNPEQAFVCSETVSVERKPSKVDKSIDDLIKLFFSLKISPAYDVGTPLVLKFTRRSANKDQEILPCMPDQYDGEWDGADLLSAQAA